MVRVYQPRAGRGLAERLFNRPLQPRIANTTIMVIATSLTVGATLSDRWWHENGNREPVEQETALPPLISADCPARRLPDALLTF
jgi:hypothetical protein